MNTFGGSWSELKLDCVENYTTAYLKVMQNQSWWKLHYVDAFAGRGKQKLKSRTAESVVTPEIESFFGTKEDRRDTEDFLLGSALRAIKASRAAQRPFDHFTLIDADQSSCTELESHIQREFSDIAHTVTVECRDANAALDNYISKADWSDIRALVFLDPYGLEVRWDTITRLAATEACDVWYLFPLGGVIRMMTNNGQILDSWQARLDELFGTHDWYNEFYRQGKQQSLFDDDPGQMQKDASTGHVVRYIRQRLGTTFKAVSDAGILRNGKGAPLFALVLGVSSPSQKAQEAALRIANSLLMDLRK